jgi:hypothetical protein
MANLSAIFHAGESLAQYLNQTYPDTLRQQAACEFVFMGTGKLISKAPNTNTLSIVVYNLMVNEHSRTAMRRTGPAAGTVPLGLDLYLLLTAWTDNTFAEHSIMGWTMRQLYLTPILDTSVLVPAGQWEAGDALQIIPIDLRVEEMTRIWEAMQQPYRLSVAYLARVLYIDVPPEPDHAPVVATRFTYTKHPNGATEP